MIVVLYQHNYYYYYFNQQGGEHRHEDHALQAAFGFWHNWPLA